MITEGLEDRLVARQQRQAGLLTLVGEGNQVSSSVLADVSQALIQEARLLDTGQYRRWYDWLCDDLIYWVPARENRYRRDRRPEIFPGCASLFDDDKCDIDLRLKRLESGMAWTEDPTTRAIMQVTNIEAFETDDASLIEVHSCFALYRNRAESDDSLLMGRRADLMHRAAGNLRFYGRLVRLSQSVLLAKNISTFF